MSSEVRQGDCLDVDQDLATARSLRVSHGLRYESRSLSSFVSHCCLRRSQERSWHSTEESFSRRWLRARWDRREVEAVPGGGHRP